MTGVAGIRDLQAFGFARRNEPESMAADVDIANCLLDLRHVASYALASATARLMMRVLLDSGRARSVGRTRPVALQAHDIAGLDQVGIVGRAMDIVATETSNAMRVHDARHKIVPLHAILVRRAIGEVGERGLTRFMLLEFPELLEVEPHVKTGRPVEISSRDGVPGWSSL